MDASSPADPALVFGPFELRPGQKLLLRDGQPVRLGSRALELLCVLVGRAGEIVSRNELVASVWPRTVVEETSLRVHVSALRKAMGDGQDGVRYITNVPGRGYGFVAPVTTKAVGSSPSPREQATTTPPGLPPSLTRAIGRSEIIATLAQQLKTRRLVSIVGAGGMGKTTVALEVAKACQGEYREGACFVDLAPLGDPSQVSSAVGAALGIPLPESNPWSSLAAHLRDSRVLIVLDNCEHVVDAAASLAERVLRTCPGVDILTTSREALDAEGEWVHRLQALATPAAADILDARAALHYPAVELFVERAMANSDTFALTDANLAVVREICLQLDGMPLAIELAAGRIDTFGVKGLADRLGDLFRGLMAGRRTALPRHRTLLALLDWSHDLLSECERAVLRRLAVFRAGFTLDSAAAVAADAALPAAAVIDGVVSLSAKSLVIADMNAEIAHFRLLFTTRQYAMGKLVASAELEVVRQRHAAHFRHMSRDWVREFGAQPSAQGVARFCRVVDDIRAALDWSFSPSGDEEIGIALTSETLELRFCLGFVDDFKRHVDMALERVARMRPPQPDLELRLTAGWYHLSGQSPTHARRQAEFHERILRLCDMSGSHRDRIEALYGLLVGAFGQGRYDHVKAVVQRLRPLATGRWEPLQVILCDRFLLMAHHFLGDHRAAKLLFDKVACFEAKDEDRWYVGRVPRTVSMRIYRARIHWIEGEADRALALALEAVDLGRQNHPFALTQALGMAAIPIALWRGDDVLARRLIGQLIDHIQPFALAYWRSIADSCLRALQLRSASPAPHDHSPANTEWQAPGNPMELDLIATLSEHLVTAQAVGRVNAGLVGWCGPEVLRADACMRLATGTISLVEATRILDRALGMARAQGALAWELRIATTQARLCRGQDRQMHALQSLSEVVSRFKEGAGTVDLLAARALLTEGHRAQRAAG